MKIIQINAWFGRLSTPLTRFIQKEQADIVCLQEAFAPGTESLKNFQDQYGFVDELIKVEVGNFPHTFFVAAFGFGMSGASIDEGNLILSKYPLSNLQTFYTLGQYEVKQEVGETMTNTRVLQTCTAEISPNQHLQLVNYQGYWPGTNHQGDQTTLATLQKVHDAIAGLPRPLVFCSDLNVSPASPHLQSLDDLELVNLTKTHAIKTTLSSVHRAPLPDRDSVACDYIFVSKDIKVKSFKVSEEIVSDHKALILEFEL